MQKRLGYSGRGRCVWTEAGDLYDAPRDRVGDAGRLEAAIHGCTMKAAAKPAPAVLRLNQVLDLNAASPLAAEFLALRGGAVEVDASAVERLGAQCLQVLLSARRTWGADGAAFAVVSASDEFTSTAALLGAPIDQHFNAREIA